jgi:hypothetical protein
LFHHGKGDFVMHKIIAGLAATLFAAQAQAAAVNSASFFPAVVPTLDEMGLVALTLVVAIAGGYAARRRRK